MGITPFFRIWALLSAQIYKICTLLSTGIVENVFSNRRGGACNALPDVAFGDIPRGVCELRR